MGHTSPNVPIRHVNYILHIFLYGGDGEDTGHGGQSEEVRGVHTWYKTGSTDGGLCRLCADAVSNGRLVVSGVYRGIAEFDRRSDAHTRGLLWRDSVIDSGKRGIAYNETNRSDGGNAALRRLHEMRYKNATVNDGSSRCRQRYTGGGFGKRI